MYLLSNISIKILIFNVFFTSKISFFFFYFYFLPFESFQLSTKILYLFCLIVHISTVILNSLTWLQYCSPLKSLFLFSFVSPDSHSCHLTALCVHCFLLHAKQGIWKFAFRNNLRCRMMAYFSRINFYLLLSYSWEHWSSGINSIPVVGGRWFGARFLSLRGLFYFSFILICRK